MKHLGLLVFLVVPYICSAKITVESDAPNSKTTVVARNVTIGKIEFRLIDKPHHLFIGRCYQKKHKVLHQENILLTNDGKSHLSAIIRVNIQGPVRITCANIYDQSENGQGAYPSYSAGGVGYKFVEFNVLTSYGKGFHFYIQIYGVDEEDYPRKKG